MRNMIVCIVIALVCHNGALAANGYSVFEFGDSVETVLEKGKTVCQFGVVEKDSRWFWRSYLDCKRFRFKKGVIAYLSFWFTDNELSRIYLASVDIQNKFFRRYPNYTYLLPFKEKVNSDTSINLMDEMFFKDNVHYLKGVYRYTTFFYNNRWEWEYLFEEDTFLRDERKRKEERLRKEREAGLSGWSKFKFGETTGKIKEKIRGMCSTMKVKMGTNKRETIRCDRFSFMDRKIDLLFTFSESTLVKIELLLDKSQYQLLLGLLKRKYGPPYRELGENELYYPSIEFPEKNIALYYSKTVSSKTDVGLVLRYTKEGYSDTSQSDANKDSKAKEAGESNRATRWLDSI